MLEKNLAQRGLIVLGAVLIAVWALSAKGLKYGNDIAGGVSMIFEINDEGIEDYQGNLAEEMKTLLQKRVDPRGVYNLNWRVVGNNRIEVQMPLPPAEVGELRDTYVTSLASLAGTNVDRGALIKALNLPEAERNSRLEAMSQGIASRKEALAQSAVAYEALAKARAALAEARQRVVAAEAQATSAESETATEGDEGASDDAAEEDIAAADESNSAEAVPTDEELRELRIAVRTADEEFEDTLADVFEANFPTRRFETLLEMGDTPNRAEQLAELEEEYPTLSEKMGEVTTTYDAWAARRTYLDGPADLRRLISGAGVLSFRMLAEPDPNNLTRFAELRDLLAERGPKQANLRASETLVSWFRIDDPVNFFNLRSGRELEEQDLDTLGRNTYVIGQYGEDYFVLAKTDGANTMIGDKSSPWQLRQVGIFTDDLGRPQVNFEFDAAGGGLFSKLTGANINKQLGTFLDDVAYSAANINSQIGRRGTIQGDFTLDKVSYLVQSMQAGALPARLKDTPISERTLGSSLGAANLERALTAGIVGVAVVVGIMLLYYLWAGLVANVALMLNVLLVLGMMSFLDARLTLAGIAGIILTIGMSVDANVLIFERMREEKERGSSLRMIVKNGYDKAFSTIIDANITTLLTCIILYYIGSEEVKGFGITLGLGIVISLFTALFVTRLLFGAMLKYRVIKDIQMLKLIGVPNIDWYSKRKIFLPLSATIMVIGVAALFGRGADALDVEFRGGVNAEFALVSDQVEVDGSQVSVDDVQIRSLLASTVASYGSDASKLANAEVSSVDGQGNVARVRVEGVSAPRLAALLAEPLEDAKFLTRAGVDTSQGDGVLQLRLAGDRTADDVKAFIDDNASDIETSVATLENASITEVLETTDDAERGLVWNLATTVTNKRLAQSVLEEMFGDQLDRQPAVAYELELDGDLPFPVTETELGANVLGLDPVASAQDVSSFLGGAVMIFDNMTPALSVEALELRLRNMRLQPDYEDLPWREVGVMGLAPTGRQDARGRDTYTSVAVAVVDPQLDFETTNSEAWREELARKELALARDTLSAEQSLRKVSQFKPQIASQSQVQAVLALLLSWGMIIGYLWFRFGRWMYGVAGVAALFHDVLIALAAVGIAGIIGGQNVPLLRNLLLIDDFHINMTIVAAFLTIIGYSINDTIVVFDRIRETRGRLGQVTPEVINTSINQCLSRTIMTSATTLIVLLTMYIFGGASIRGFNYCMIIGILTGTYSSIAVAAPLLMVGMQRADKKRAARTAAAAS